MHRTISFTIEGEPVPKGRHRPAGNTIKRALEFLSDRTHLNLLQIITLRKILGAKQKFRTPTRTRGWEYAAGLQAKTAMRGQEPLQGPLILIAVFYLPRPKRIPKERKGLPACKPDDDNLLKSLKDSLNGICWKDDAQIVLGMQTKLYETDHIRPKTDVCIIETDFNEVLCFSQAFMSNLMN